MTEVGALLQAAVEGATAAGWADEPVRQQSSGGPLAVQLLWPAQGTPPRVAPEALPRHPNAAPGQTPLPALAGSSPQV